jgi:hypothetical protein
MVSASNVMHMYSMRHLYFLHQNICSRHKQDGMPQKPHVAGMRATNTSEQDKKDFYCLCTCHLQKVSAQSTQVRCAEHSNTKALLHNMHETPTLASCSASV